MAHPTPATNQVDPALEVVSTSTFNFPSSESRQKRPKVEVSVDSEETTKPQTKVTVSTTPSTSRLAKHDSDSGFYRLGLPSGHLFYDFQSVSATSIRGRNQAKFSAAAKQKRTRLTVEAVTSLLGDGVDAASLTVSDFFFVMYWLRLNGAGTSQFRVKAGCYDPQHVLDVAQKRKPVESLYTVELVSKTNLKETELDKELVKTFFEEHKGGIEELARLGFALTAPRMYDSIELEEKWDGKPEFDEVEFLSELAGSIQSTEKHMDLEQRLAVVGEFPMELLTLLQEWQLVVQSYGVEESIHLNCKECGAQIETEVSISASDFL